MPVFGSKKAAPQTAPETETAPEPQPSEASATERLNALLTEHAELESAIGGYREERSRLMRESEAPSLGAITSLAAQTAQTELQMEWIKHQLPGIQAEVEVERREAWEHAWQAQHRPILAQAEAELTEATRTFLTALEQANTAYGRAQHFGERLHEFVRPPPMLIFNEWSLKQYLEAVTLRQRPAVAMSLVELAVEAPLFIPPAERFVPRRVPYQLVEQISAIAPMRRVKMLHTIRASNLNIGHARLKAGEEMDFSARAAFVLTYSGCGVYTDVETAETATAAA